MTITTYRVPSFTRTQEVRTTVSLEDFNVDEVAEYLRSVGYQVDGTFSRAMVDALNAKRGRRRVNDDDDEDPEYEYGAFVLRSELARAETLVLCGQREVARNYILDIVSDAMGRQL